MGGPGRSKGSGKEKGGEGKPSKGSGKDNQISTQSSAIQSLVKDASKTGRRYGGPISLQELQSRGVQTLKGVAIVVASESGCSTCLIQLGSNGRKIPIEIKNLCKLDGVDIELSDTFHRITKPFGKVDQVKDMVLDRVTANLLEFLRTENLLSTDPEQIIRGKLEADKTLELFVSDEVVKQLRLSTDPKASLSTMADFGFPALNFPRGHSLLVGKDKRPGTMTKFYEFLVDLLLDNENQDTLPNTLKNLSRQSDQKKIQLLGVMFHKDPTRGEFSATAKWLKSSWSQYHAAIRSKVAQEDLEEDVVFDTSASASTAPVMGRGS
jgi:hypothetical protein